MAYSKRNWLSGTTPISKDNLEAMDEGLYQNDTDIEKLKDSMVADNLRKIIGVYPMIEYPGAPTEATVGKLGQLYQDTTTKKLYICTYIVNGKYTWDDFVMAFRKIAGLNLKADITAKQLQSALKVYPLKQLSSDPTAVGANIAGESGQFGYLLEYDTVTLKHIAKLYLCRGISGDSYLWNLVGGFSSGSTISQSDIEAAIKKYFEDHPDAGGGADGKSAYQVALDNGYEGTEKEWLESLKGADGKSPVVKATDVSDGVALSIESPDGAISTTKIKQGKDGYTPVKGEDYFTDEEKAQIVTEAKAGLSQIEPPTIVKSVDEMTDTSKHYVLNGDIYAYMSGKSGLTPDFTNLADTTLTTDATITTTSNGWLEDVRINSSNAIATADGNDITNYITIGNASVVRIKNMDINGGYGRIYFYSNGAYLFGLSVGDATLNYFTEINDEYAEITSAKLLECLKANKGNSAAFDKIRFGGTLTGTKEDVIVTLDEEITYSEETGYEWKNTGLQYTATLYTDLIGIVDENNVIRLSSNNLPSGTYTLKYGDESFDTIGTITID